jgi:CPA2 family monovalent cation:H+ antiporter-2
MLGYLAVGVLIGPHAFGLAAETGATHALAEFGVVFLMFSIGLEFSLAQLRVDAAHRVRAGAGAGGADHRRHRARRPVHFDPAPELNISWQAAFALGGALAMSSTAIVVKMLTERLELESEHGRRIIGILLFQDLAVVPLLILIPSLAKDPENLAETLAWAGRQSGGVLALLLFFGQKLMRSWFTLVAKRRSQELFMLNLLLVTLGAAWITERAGLSMALGAFVAGMLISETQFKHQVEEDIKPFRDVLLGLFFITIGMLLNVQPGAHHWWLVLVLLAGPVLLKFALIAALAKAFGSSDGVAMRTGLALAQAGEFGFVLLNMASGSKLIDPFLMQLVLASMVLSMLVAPLRHRQVRPDRDEDRVQRMDDAVAPADPAGEPHDGRAKARDPGRLRAQRPERGDPAERRKTALVCARPRSGAGAGSAGGGVERVVRRRRAARGADRGRHQPRERAGDHFRRHRAALKVLHLVHELAPSLPVIVRSHDDSDLDVLRQAGATEVVPEALESSLMLASHALVMVGVPLRRVVHRVQSARDERYASLRGYFHGASDLIDDPSTPMCACIRWC